MSEVDWPALATVALTGLCLLAGVSLAIALLVVPAALKMIDELTSLVEGD